MPRPIPIYLLWFSPEMLRGDPTYNLENLLGTVIVRGPHQFRVRLLIRRRPETPDATSGTWADLWGKPFWAPIDSGKA
jgi:hypothetical protein